MVKTRWLCALGAVLPFTIVACGDAVPVRVVSQGQQGGTEAPAGEAAPTEASAPFAHPDAPLCDDLHTHGLVDGPLSEEEVRVLEGNGPSPEEQAAIDAYRARFPDTWSGWWLEHRPEGRFVFTFTEDVDVRRAELEAMFGTNRVLVERRPRSERDLRGLADLMRPLHDPDGVAYGWGVRPNVGDGVVGISLYVRDEPSVRKVVERFGGEPICVEGKAPSELIPEGPQPAGGEVWRFLGAGSGGRAYTSAAAQDQQAYEALWASTGLAGPPPPVDFTREVAVHFGVAESCNAMRLDEVVIDAEKAMVRPEVLNPGKVGPCGLALMPYTYVVAVERDALADRFTLKPQPNLPCPPCEGDTVVELER